MAATETTVVALTSGYYGVDGKSVLVIEGDTFLAKDPVVKKHPKAFGRQAGNDVVIEQATAAPGEKRGA